MQEVGLGWLALERVALFKVCTYNQSDNKKRQIKNKNVQNCDKLTSCSTCSNGKCDDDEELDVNSWIRKLNVFLAFW